MVTLFKRRRVECLALIGLLIGACGAGCDTRGASQPSSSEPVTSPMSGLVSNEVAPALTDQGLGRTSTAFSVPDGAEWTVPTTPDVGALSPARSIFEVNPQSLLQSSPMELEGVLGRLDQEAQAISTSVSDASGMRRASQELMAVIHAKRQTALRLIEHPSSQPEQITLGQRGLLQSLSQASVMGDVAAAEELERAAASLQDHPDPLLSGDAKLVLIGFQIERVRNGKPNAKQDVLASIERYLEARPVPNVAALMVMGQAKDVLRQYDFLPEAEQVRRWIREFFVESSGLDPQVMGMAVQITSDSID